MNSRYEELFDLRDADIRGRTDNEILPGTVAKQFQEGDRRVLTEQRSYQVEEMIPQSDGLRSLLGTCP